MTVVGVPLTGVILLAIALTLATVLHRRLLGHLGGGTLQHLVRLPGNLLHELAHAFTMLLTGYTVADLSVSLGDPSGRGHVRPGPAWISIARPWITNLVSPVAPVFVAVAALAFLQPLAGVPGLPTSVSGVLPVLRAVDPTRWELWAGLALGFSVTAEMAPSGIDLAAWWRPALVATALVTAAAYGVEQLRPGMVAENWSTFEAATRAPIARALAMAVWSGVTMAPVAWLVGRLRAAIG